MRNLTKSIATLSLLTPITVYSLGIGDITMHSALNQKLNAEIGVILDRGENVDDIQVSLASHKQFEKLGIPWSYFISKLEFKPLVKSNGKVVIAVTSDLVLDDPILDFLLQVSWPNGELYKELTVFVDPPVVHLEQATHTPSVATTARAFNKVVKRSAPVSVQKNDFSRLALEGEYGPTNKNDSLWKVAEKVNTHKNTSIEQMMMALYKANPKAFYKKNVNALMAGQTLKIPKKAEILHLSKNEAHRQFYRQMAIWKGTAVTEIEIEVVAEPDIEAVEVTVTDSSKLTLEPLSQAAINQSEALTPNLTDTQDLVTENQQLQERLANLEKQFAIMQEMMAIKDQQLAAMQNVQHTNNRKTGNIGDYKAPVTPQTVIEQPVLPEVTGVVTQQQPKKIVKPAIKPAPTEKTKTPEESGSLFSYYFLAAGALIALCFAWLIGRKRQTEDEINENSMFSTASEQALSETQDLKAVPVLDKKTSYDVGSVGESSFLSEFASGDFDVFETDPAEVDPSSEADVYLAYDRYQQAEELMRHAISEQPEKDNYKLKLLEIFYASENKTSFEDYANELASAGKQTDINFWSKVTEMGSELIPHFELFSSSQAEAKFEVTDVPSDDYLNAATDIPTEVQDEKLTEAMSNYAGGDETSEFNTPESQLNSDKTDSALIEDEIESVDFDLSKFDAEEPVEDDSQDIQVMNDEQSIDFSPSDIDISLIETVEPHTDNVNDNNDFDIEFDFDDIPTKPEVELVAATEALDIKESEVSDLTDMDEFETKIDLAKAYIDMGDIPAAKTIVQEVLTKGTDAQKKEAKEILESLS